MSIEVKADDDLIIQDGHQGGIIVLQVNLTKKNLKIPAPGNCMSSHKQKLLFLLYMLLDPHLQQLSGCCSLFWVLHQTFLHKICEFITPQLWFPESGWRVCRDHKNSLT